MLFLRSLVFNISYTLWTLLISLVGIPLLVAAPKSMLARYLGLWARGTLVLLEFWCGITYEVHGANNITRFPVIYAAKHQSAWDIVMLFRLLGNPAFVLKRELVRIPLAGWYMGRMGIAINRSKGGVTMKRMLRKALRELHSRRSLVIFPEGTRTRPGTKNPYQPGVGLLYTQLKVPVVPIALNSGTCWGRNAFMKYPGRIIVEFLPAIAPGLHAREFNLILEYQIEEACSAFTSPLPLAGEAG